jgi:hypothetical protein
MAIGEILISYSLGFHESLQMAQVTTFPAITRSLLQEPRQSGLWLNRSPQSEQLPEMTYRTDKVKSLEVREVNGCQ